MAPDELSGRLYAIDSAGGVSMIADSGLPIGGDVGVESVGFLPHGFARGGTVYYADRGPDILLRLDAHSLTGVGLHDGDLLAATESGGLMIGVRCATTCDVVPVISTASTAHGEGHLAVTSRTPAVTHAATAVAPQRAVILAGVAAVLLVGIALITLLRLRR